MTPLVRAAVFHFKKWETVYCSEMNDAETEMAVTNAPACGEGTSCDNLNCLSPEGQDARLFIRWMQGRPCGKLQPKDFPWRRVVRGAFWFLKKLYLPLVPSRRNHPGWISSSEEKYGGNIYKGNDINLSFYFAMGGHASGGQNFLEIFGDLVNAYMVGKGDGVAVLSQIQLTSLEIREILWGLGEFEEMRSGPEEKFLQWLSKELGEDPRDLSVNEKQEKSEKESEEVEGDTEMSGNGASVGLANTKGEVFKKPTVVREGEKIILPKGMSCPQAIEALKKQMAEEEREVGIDEVIEGAALYEGLFAFQTALKEKFGWADYVPTPGFFGDSPPVTITIDVDVDMKAQVFWGRVQIPNITGYLQTGYTVKKGRVFFRISGIVKQKDRETVASIANLTRKFARDRSIYRGKAIHVTFPNMENENADITECPTFMDTSKIDTKQLIFSEELQQEVEMNLYNPVEFTDKFRKLGNSLKRGVLLAGEYGTGKTLAATVLARKCTDNGWTYLYLKEPKDLAKALHMAQQYQPAVVFVEDIDRVVGVDRDLEVDNILNTLDGVDTKNDEVMVVFTTNHLDKINKALLRCKRLDAVISVTPPDPAAVRNLIRKYTRGHLSPKANLETVSDLLAGQIAATIEEVCVRAQLAAISHMGSGELVLEDRDLETAARSMLKQQELTRIPEQKTYNDDVEKAADVLGTHISSTAKMLLSGFAQQQAPLPPAKSDTKNGNLTKAANKPLPG